jgi:hypothetical protein
MMFLKHVFVLLLVYFLENKKAIPFAVAIKMTFW